MKAYRLIGLALAGLAVVGFLGCVTPPLRRLGLRLHKRWSFIIVATDAAKGWGNAAHPFLCRLSNERIAMTYWVAGDGAFQGTAPVDWPAYSDDNGQTWKFGDPYVWADGAPTNLTTSIQKGTAYSFNLGLFFAGALLPNGIRLVRERLLESPPWSAQMIWSAAGGQAWHGPEPVSFSWDSLRHDLKFLCFENESVVASDGTIFSVAYTSEGTNTLLSTALFASTNAGLGYELRSMVASPKDAPWGSDGPCEPALALLADGGLLCVMRTGSKGQYNADGPNYSSDMLMARSKDGGRTWSHERMPIPGVMPKLLRMSNGVLVLAFGRPGNNLVFSLDNGRTWGRELALTGADIKTTGYCDILEVSPNRLLAVYDAFNMDVRGIWLWEPQKANGILGVFVDVKRTW